ncbi:HSP20-like chaperone [Trametes cingulata]|nr:HSP20-like chaperone [Trametes cingulata]
MSPQYTFQPALPAQSRPLFTKAQKMLQQEDPRYRDIDRMLARAYVELQRQRLQQKRAGLFMPRMDLCDDPDNPLVTAVLELPGMKAEQLSVRIENGHLIVEGQRTGPHLHGSPRNADTSSEPTPSALYPVQEIKYGKFRREVKLPQGITAAHVRSTLAEGMLTVSWPRDPSALTRHGSQATQPAVAQSNSEHGGGGTYPA